MSKLSMDFLGKEMQGRVKSYNKNKGYGYIFTENGYDLFLSFHDIKEGDSNIFVGTVVKFTVGKYNGRLVAQDVSIIESYKDGVETILLPNGKELKIKKIIRFGCANAYETIQKKGITREMLKEHGYSLESLNYVYIDTEDLSYMFFSDNSPITSSGKTDLVALMSLLNTSLIKL